MARPLMSPEAMQQRRDLALRLLAGGESSIRAVAAVVGAHPSSVHAWQRAAGDMGAAALVVFDRHHTVGVAWDEGGARTRQAERAARRRGAGGPLAIQSSDARRKRRQPEGEPRRRKRERRMGETLRAYLNLPELPQQPSPVQPAMDMSPQYSWATPALKTKITAILQIHPLSVARGGLTLAELRRILGTAYEDQYDASPLERAQSAEQFRVTMVRFAFACTAEGRWSAP